MEIYNGNMVYFNRMSIFIPCYLSAGAEEIGVDSQMIVKNSKVRQKLVSW